MDKFTKLIENALSDEQCDLAIKYFNDNEEKVDMLKAWSVEEQDYIVEESRKILALRVELNTEIDRMFEKSCGEALQEYVNSMDMYPQTATYDSGYSLYKYNTGEHYYDWHSDDMPNMPRIATMLWYLNDVEEGGETEFAFGMKVKPKKGNVLIFPSNFCFNHRACIPVSGPKYVGLTFIVNTPPV